MTVKNSHFFVFILYTNYALLFKINFKLFNFILIINLYLGIPIDLFMMKLKEQQNEKFN